jgi:hypothetical protein
VNVKREIQRFGPWPVIALLTLVGLALRMAAARGGMWTDEAWSVVFAAQARDPLGIFLRINHDNNHHLNSLWLQAIGMHASSMLARAPAILAGTLTIPAAALLFARRSSAGAIAAAALFAISPIMVTYGSEARGYASMILATIIMIWLVTNSVEGHAKSSTQWLIALTAAPDLVGLSREAFIDGCAAGNERYTRVDGARVFGMRCHAARHGASRNTKSDGVADRRL